ncbi:nuclear transport factor 2 family protein [Kribbella sp. NPDC049584]|uniref:YybH family protein n=1 Tax=Kribbella sp. NPDC049584 TaxID=3154833 RepID=UPI0034191C19
MSQARTATNEVDEFLADVLPRQEQEERALRNGDPGPRLRMWSRNDPVTVLGAAGPKGTGTGWERVSEVFQWISSQFSDCTEYEFELLAAGVSGDLAYTVGFERSTMSIAGGPARSSVIRATHVYRREDGEWKIVHRHGDVTFPAGAAGLPADLVPGNAADQAGPRQ